MDWHIEALKLLLQSKVEKSKQDPLGTEIDKLFQSLQSYYFINDEMILETKLHLLSYMARLYNQPNIKDVSLEQIIIDLKAAIMIAEKVTHDKAVWTVDFESAFGSRSKLKAWERTFLNNRLEYKVGFDAKAFETMLGSLKQPNIVAAFVKELRQEKENKDVDIYATQEVKDLLNKFSPSTRVKLPTGEIITDEEYQARLAPVRDLSGNITASHDALAQAIATPAPQRRIQPTVKPDSPPLQANVAPQAGQARSSATSSTAKPAINPAIEELVQQLRAPIQRYIKSRKGIGLFAAFRDSKMTDLKVDAAEALSKQLEGLAANPSTTIRDLQQAFENASKLNTGIEKKNKKTYAPGFGSGFARSIGQATQILEQETVTATLTKKKK